MEKIVSGFGLALAFVGVSLGDSMLVPPDFQTIGTILLITSMRLRIVVRGSPATDVLATAITFCSVCGRVVRWEYHANFISEGTYFILWRSCCSGLLCACGAVRAFHYRCRYDAVRSTSGTRSPRRRVVPVSLKARKLILPGITTGIIGYALEYLGIALVSFSKRWGIARPALQRQCSDRTPTCFASL